MKSVDRDRERLLDDYLAAAARAGDRRALRLLVRRWNPKLLRHAARLTGDADLARDMAQEAWEQIVRGLQRLDDTSAFAAWAYRITTRRCARAIRRLVKQRRLQSELEAEPPLPPPQDKTAEQADEVRLVLAAAHALPGAQRAALALHYLEEMNVADIAIALDTPPGTIKTRLMHARRKIRDSLKGNEDA